MDIGEALAKALAKAYEDGYEQGKKDAVRHGHWIERKEIFDGETNEVDAIGCSVCGKSQKKQRKTPYCPNCGAKMGVQ